MLYLPDPGLDAAAIQKLDEYQTEVNNAVNYADRVATGKHLFSTRNRSNNPAFKSVRRTLSLMCAGAQRCVYCEDSVGDEVEHIKPKDLYPEDVFRWPNYVYACGQCNGGKSNKFAVLTRSGLQIVTRPRGAPIVAPDDGEPAFINPRIEDPLSFFTIDLLGTFLVLPASDITSEEEARANFTIDTLGLNRDLLLVARSNAYGGYRSRLFEYCKQREARADQVKLTRLQRDLLATPHPTVWEEMKRQAMHIPEIATLFNEVPEAGYWSHSERMTDDGAAMLNIT